MSRRSASGILLGKISSPCRSLFGETGATSYEFTLNVFNAKVLAC